MSKKVSIAVVRRLPRYYRHLASLIDSGVVRMSSEGLGNRMGLTASQVRQDFSCFGGFGQQGYGYNVETLYRQIGSILGADGQYNVVIIGAGNMGHALANHSSFKKMGFKIIGIFDVNPMLIGTKIREIEIIHIDSMDEFCMENHVDIAVLCVPSNRTCDIAKKMISLNIKGIWNFSTVELEVPNDTVVENVHLSDSLMVLGFCIKGKSKA